MSGLWAHWQGAAAYAKYLSPEFDQFVNAAPREWVEGDIVLTNMQRVYAPEIADQAIGYLLAFTRSLTHFIRVQPGQKGRSREAGLVLDELMGKTLLVIGLGGIGSEIARRAHAFGMRVLATDPKVLERPLYVEELRRPDAFHALLLRADVVAAAVPLTRSSHRNDRCKGIRHDEARGRPDQFVARHGNRHRCSGRRPGRRHEVFHENLRGFAAGEMLLNVVNKNVGY